WDRDSTAPTGLRTPWNCVPDDLSRPGPDNLLTLNERVSGPPPGGAAGRTDQGIPQCGEGRAASGRCVRQTGERHEVRGDFDRRGRRRSPGSSQEGLKVHEGGRIRSGSPRHETPPEARGTSPREGGGYFDRPSSGRL